MSSMPSSVSESGVSPFAGLPASLWWGAALAGALFGVGEGQLAGEAPVLCALLGGIGAAAGLAFLVLAGRPLGRALARLSPIRRCPMERTR